MLPETLKWRTIIFLKILEFTGMFFNNNYKIDCKPIKYYHGISPM